MINDLKDEIKMYLIKKRKYPSQVHIDRIIIILLKIKYLCDNKKYTYEEIINDKKNQELKYKNTTIKTNYNDIKINIFLPLIQYKSLKELVKDLLQNYKTGINTFNKGKKKVCLMSKTNYNCYDIEGKTTYIINNEPLSNYYKLEDFQFFDEVLGLNNKYVEWKEVNFSEFKYAYIYENNPQYIYIKQPKIYETSKLIMNENENIKIIMHTDFKKVSNIKDCGTFINRISKIIIFDDLNTFLQFENKKDDNISIIRYNEKKISSLEKLYEIIKNNRKQKDILIKITVDDIIKNHYRIGLKLYQEKVKFEKKDINKIVDENTRLIKKIELINKRVEEEINKIINK